MFHLQELCGARYICSLFELWAQFHRLWMCILLSYCRLLSNVSSVIRTMVQACASIGCTPALQMVCTGDNCACASQYILCSYQHNETLIDSIWNRYRSELPSRCCGWWVPPFEKKSYAIHIKQEFNYKVVQIWPGQIFFKKTIIIKVAQMLRCAACLHKNQSRSYLNHLV
jgi:hypothetical protein